MIACGLFLLALGYGLDSAPVAALARAVGQLEAMSRTTGQTPHMRLSAAFSDGKTLYAARYSSDHIAPSVYYRYSDSRKGWAVVSEPLERDEDGWQELAPGQFLTLTPTEARVQAFDPIGT